MSKKKISAEFKDSLILVLQRYWVAEIMLAKRTRPKRQLYLTATSIRSISSDTFICKYYAMALIPRQVKVNFKDIEFIKPRIKRRKIISNIDFMKITNNFKDEVWRKMVYKTQFFKWSLLIGLLIVVTAISLLFAMFLK